jgi:MFS family permease
MTVSSTPVTIGKPQWHSTRAIFFIGGLVAATWASLVPYAKSRAGLDDGTLGLLLLCLGVGSILAMPATGALVAKFGCRKVLIAATLVICTALPALSIVSSVPLLAFALFVFGAGVGSADCAFNIQAVTVESVSKRPLMSGFHGFFSVGGIVGAALASGLLSLGASPLGSALTGVVLILTLLAATFRGLLSSAGASGGPPFAIPRSIVLFLGVLCFVVFLVEGAMLDWSAVFLEEQRGLRPAQAGFGYACFALTMTVGRLTGDVIVRKLGARTIVAGGGAMASLGIVLATLVPSWAISLVGYAMVGIGCSNIVPVLFSAVGRQRKMPQAVAVPALTTLGYAGILIGPAGIGFIAHHSSLIVAFLCIAVLMAGVAISGRAFQSTTSATT